MQNKKKSFCCPYCGGKVEIRQAREIYHNNSIQGRVYVCRNFPACDALVWADCNTGAPLGELANRALRELRKKAHFEFDRIWKEGLMTRQNAYRWMADYFGIQLCEAHIGQFSDYRCKQLIQKCRELEKRKA